MGDIRQMMPPGAMIGGPGGMGPSDREMDEQRRAASVQIAIASLQANGAYDDDVLIERARKISAFIKNGAGGR